MTSGATTAVSTHTAVIADMADRVVSISHGRVAAGRRNEKRTPAASLSW